MKKYIVKHLNKELPVEANNAIEALELACEQHSPPDFRDPESNLIKVVCESGLVIKFTAYQGVQP